MLQPARRGLVIFFVMGAWVGATLEEPGEQLVEPSRACTRTRAGVVIMAPADYGLVGPTFSVDFQVVARVHGANWHPRLFVCALFKLSECSPNCTRIELAGARGQSTRDGRVRCGACQQQPRSQFHAQHDGTCVFCMLAPVYPYRRTRICA